MRFMPRFVRRAGRKLLAKANVEWPSRWMFELRLTEMRWRNSLSPVLYGFRQVDDLSRFALLSARSLPRV